MTQMQTLLKWRRRNDSYYSKGTERASQTKCKKVRAINVETGEVLTISSVKEAVSKGYAHGGVSQACRGIYCDGNLYKCHKWSYE